MTFNIGDKVTVIKDDIEYPSAIPLGTTGVVKRIDTSGSGRVIHVDFSSIGRSDWVTRVEYLSLSENFKPKFMLTYYRNSQDPHEILEKRRAVNKRIGELLADKSVNRDSIQLIEIKRMWKINVSYKMKEA
jgi:hypothetical protein